MTSPSMASSTMASSTTTDKLEFPPGFKQENHWLRWCPTSPELLAETEAKIFQRIESDYKTSFVEIDEDCHIRTLITEPTDPSNAQNTPIVMIHGFLGGIGILIKNINSLSKTRRVFVFDLMGFGRSSRVPLLGDAMEVEESYVSSIEKWRQKVGLDKFVLLGHSLGGFMSTAYALRHPDQVKHLILVDPWGYGVKPDDDRVVWTRNGENVYVSSVPMKYRMFLYFGTRVNALSVLRLLGPLGPAAFRKWRPDLEVQFVDLIGSGVMYDYLYHCNMQQPTGEEAFRALQGATVWASNPMLKRIGSLPDYVPMTLIYGARTWVDSTQGFAIKEQRPNSYCDFQMIEGGGHHVYFDHPREFNASVEKICSTVDSESGTSL